MANTHYIIEILIKLIHKTMTYSKISFISRSFMKTLATKGDGTLSIRSLLESLFSPSKKRRAYYLDIVSEVVQMKKYVSQQTSNGQLNLCFGTSRQNKPTWEGYCTISHHLKILCPFSGMIFQWCSMYLDNSPLFLMV